MDVVAAVAEDSAISIDEANLGLGGDDPFESRLCDWHVYPLFSSTGGIVREWRVLAMRNLILQDWRDGGLRGARVMMDACRGPNALSSIQRPWRESRSSEGRVL